MIIPLIKLINDMFLQVIMKDEIFEWAQNSVEAVEKLPEIADDGAVVNQALHTNEPK